MGIKKFKEDKRIFIRYMEEQMRKKLFFFGYDLANLDFLTLLKNICIDEELGTTPQFNALSFLVFFIRLISSI